MIAAHAVHTTGLNWESLAVTVATIVATVGAGVGWTVNRIERSRRQAEQRVDELRIQTDRSITSKVGDVARRLDDVDRHLGHQDEVLQQVGERVATIEGRLMNGWGPGSAGRGNPPR